MNKNFIFNTKVKCPKCKSDNFTLHEMWKGHTISWEVTNGTFDINEGIMDVGNPYQVQAYCKNCKHPWTLRKITQINDVIL